MKCEVVRDLIPLVIDDVASEESRNLVGEHLETCEACRAYRDGMAAQLEKPAPVEDDTSFIRFCRRLQKNFRWRRLALGAGGGAGRGRGGIRRADGVRQYLCQL